MSSSSAKGKWVITGGAGFIGCHAAAQLHAAGHRVVVVDNLSRRGTDANLAWLREQGVDDVIRADIRDARAMSFKHKVGNLLLSIAMSMLFFQWVRDSQSGMWVFRRSIIKDMKLESDSMSFSEEIKIEVLRNSRLRFGEILILYSARLGAIKLNPWRDGFQNLWFLVKKRFIR